MSTRRVSALAYQRIRDEGLLGRLQLAVYSCLFHQGPLTTRRISARTGIEPHVVSPRLTELCERGVLEDVGTVECEFTGQMVTLWDLNDRMPGPKVKKRRPEKCCRCHGTGKEPEHGEATLFPMGAA